MKRRLPLIFILAVMAVLAAVPLLLGVRHRSALERYRQSLRASGQLKTLAEATPAPLVNTLNGAPALTSLLIRLPAVPTELQPLSARGLPAGKRGVTWSQTILPTEQTTNVWPALRDFLSTNATDLAALRSACDAPVFDFPLRYQDGIKMLFPHLPSAKRLAQTLAADALLQLHDGHPDAALADVRGGVQFVARWNREPLLITQLVRIAIGSSMANSTWELLQFRGWTDADLAALQGAWQELDLSAIADRTFDMEQAWGQEAAHNLLTRADHDAMQVAMGGNPSPTFSEILNSCLDDPRAGFDEAWDRYPRWWAFRLWRCHQLELVNLQQTQAAREACRAAAASGAWFGPTDQAKQVIAGLEATVPRLPAYVFSGDSSYGSVLSKFAAFQSQRSLVLAAIALERYRLKHGQYPEHSAQLTPEFLAAVPRDDMDGQPLRYRRNADGTFTLYSIGEDGRDDGGDPTPTRTLPSWLHGKDLLWPQPASAAEVEG